MPGTVPLSPDKEAAGEIHRTHLLASETLAPAHLPRASRAEPIRADFKRRLRGDKGYSARGFEAAYSLQLEVAKSMLRGMSRVLLVDDVCTEGSTISACMWACGSLVRGWRWSQQPPVR